MTTRQRIYLMGTLWPKACEAQGWDRKDNELRHEIYVRALGQAKRSSEFTNEDFGRVKNYLLMLADNIGGAVEVDRPDQDEKRRLIWKIKHEYMKCLAVYIEHPQAYLEAILKDEHKTRFLDDLSAVDDSDEKRPLDTPSSELKRLIFTLSARVQNLRKKSGDTIKAMRIKAGLQKPAPVPELATEDCQF